MEQNSLSGNKYTKFENIDQKCKHWRKLHKEDFVSLKRRILFVFFLGVSYHFMVYKLILIGVPFVWNSLVFTLLYFFLFSEVLLIFDKIIGRRYPWHLEVKNRVILLFCFSVVWLFVMKKTAPLIKPLFVPDDIIDNPEIDDLAFALGILYMIIYVVLIIAHNFHTALNYFKDENEKLKQDKILSDYKALQDQLNPHFLFNNLSTLIAIIRTDKDKAINFAENFTDVYRYVLNSEGEAVISLKEELSFLASYTTLHIARIGDGLSVTIEVEDEVLQKKVPHLSLQVLVENAIKHNITSKTKPLFIRIGVSGNKLYVANNKQLKETTYSTKTGLSNLGKRLKILTDEEYRIIEDEDSFRVELPLID